MSLEDLGRRAVACKHWRWMGGMAVLDRPMWRVVDRVGLPPYMVHGYEEESLGGMLPDLSDPATLGCLLALVREAWGDECACALPVDYGPGGVMWVCQLTAGGRSLTARHWVTEAEALVAALEASPTE